MPAENKRKLKVEEKSSSDLLSITLDSDCIGVTVEATGTAKVYVGWNERATPGKGTILPGTNKSYGVGWPYVLDGQVLNVDFDATGNKSATVTILRDGGQISC